LRNENRDVEAFDPTYPKSVFVDEEIDLFGVGK
jgi:hypothetical protein